MSWNWLKSLLRLGARAKLVGTDLAGNQYFERTVTRGSKPRRSVKIRDSGSVDEYTQDSIPPEWDRWLRGLQDDPPGTEEMRARVLQAQILQKKVSDVEQRDKELREKEISEGLVAAGPQRTTHTGHASAPAFKTQEPAEEPTSTGKDFQPASWKPPSKNAK